MNATVKAAASKSRSGRRSEKADGVVKEGPHSMGRIYRDEAVIAGSVPSCVYQRCGGGRRILKKMIGNN